MPRAVIDLNSSSGLAAVNGQWKFAQGLVPGEPNDAHTPSALKKAGYRMPYLKLCSCLLILLKVSFGIFYPG